jgi:hypothetical protein
MEGEGTLAVDHAVLQKIMSCKPAMLWQVSLGGFTMELRQSRGSEPLAPRYSLVFWISREPDKVSVTYLGCDPEQAIEIFCRKVEFHQRLMSA